MSMFRILFITATFGLPAAGMTKADPPANLAGQAVTDWRDLIKPKTDDVCFRTVNWLPTFWDGVMTAQKEDKPILLWAMNGHPLACT
jgi:hypothetical protein